MIRAAIFDLDGTLVDSLPGIAQGLNRALEARGHAAHPMERVRSFIGNGSWMLAKRGLMNDPSDADVNDLEEAFLHHYAETWREGTTLYPGIRELLEDLQGQGVPLAVFSNKPHRFTVEIVETLFDWVSFATVLGQGEDYPRKPDPAGALMIAEKLALPPEDIAFIGDSPIDYKAAVAAGMQPLLVGWGFHSADELTATAAPLMQSVKELRKCLRAPHPTG